MRVVWLVVAVLSVFVITPTVLWWAFPEVSERGQFGDQFGVANALFSGLAFVGFFYTVFLQQRQLDVQRRELELQREELSLQRDEMKASRQELKNQVLMQQALIKVTIAQISVAGINADIEADKLDAQRMSSSFQHFDQHRSSIRKASAALFELANKLEGEIPSVG